MSLPTKEKYEEIKEKRKQDQERKLQLEKQVKKDTSPINELVKLKSLAKSVCCSDFF